MKKTLINAAKYLLGLALGGLFLYLAFRNANAEEIWQSVREVEIGWLLFAQGIGLFSHYIRGVRWQMQLKASGYAPSHLNLFAAVLTGYLVNQALPRAGEVARCSVLYKSDKVPFTKAFGTVVIERVFDVCIMLALIVLAFFLEFDTIQTFLQEFMSARETGGGEVPIGIIILGAGGILGIVLLWVFRRVLMEIPLVQRVANFIRELLQSAMSIRYLQRPWLFVFYSFLIWFCYWMMSFVAFQSLPGFEDSRLNLLYLSLITTVMGGIGMTLPVPGGTGPYHFAVQFTFATLLVLGTKEASATLGQTFAVVLHSSQLITLVCAGLIGYIYLILQPGRDASLDSEPDVVPQGDIG